MQTSDKGEFAKLFSQLCEVFDRKQTPELAGSYWQALQRMPLGGFRAAVARAIETAERMPKPGQLWGLYRDARHQTMALEAVEERTTAYDHFHGFGQRCLLAYLMRNGGASVSTMPRLIAEKNRIVDDFRSLSREDTVTAIEVREALFKAFDRVHAPASRNEVELWRRDICQERGWHMAQPEVGYDGKPYP